MDTKFLFHMFLTIVCFPVSFPTRVIVCLYFFICTLCLRGWRAVTRVSRRIGRDGKSGFKYLISHCSLRCFIIVVLVLMWFAIRVGPINVLVAVAVLPVLVGAVYLDHAPQYVFDIIDDIKDEFANDVVDDADVKAVDPAPMDRIDSKSRNRVACKVAVRAMAKVGLLKATEANAMVYQRVCLDVMAEMRMRYHDRVRILPLAIVACLERGDEVKEGMDTIAHICGQRVSH